MLRTSLAAFLILISPSIAEAQQGVADCAGSQQAMNQCAGAILQMVDQEMNHRYQAAMTNRLDEEARIKLRAAQRAWLPYRDAHCAAEAGAARGGSMALLLQLSCLEHMTSARALALSQNPERIDPGLWAGVALAQLR